MNVRLRDFKPQRIVKMIPETNGSSQLKNELKIILPANTKTIPD